MARLRVVVGVDCGLGSKDGGAGDSSEGMWGGVSSAAGVLAEETFKPAAAAVARNDLIFSVCFSSSSGVMLRDARAWERGECVAISLNSVSGDE